MTGLTSNLKLGKQIGNGHFGDVFLANDDVHGEVAVKVLMQQPGETSADWQTRKQGLLREGQRLSRAAHTNVVRVHHLLEDEKKDAVLLVMDYCKGGSLQKAFDAGPMQLADVLKIATEVALGLQALHARGMLHRDIKPGNVLLTSNNVAQLGDFGLVTDDLILGYGSQAGYLDHLAPEVFRGEGTSAKSDIWALGMTMYRLIHGASWYARLPTAPRDVIADGGFARSLPWLPHVPNNWRRFVRKMMHDDKTQRYQNANQVLGALATLPTDPNWRCTVTDTEVRWRRQSRNRKFSVVWTKQSPRKYVWSASSKPVGEGRRRALGGSEVAIGHAKSEKQLCNFFAK